MAYLFEDGEGNPTSSKTLADGENTLAGREIIYSRAIKGGYLYIDMPNVASVMEFDIAWHNGHNFMAWHNLKDDELNSSFDGTSVARKIEFSFKNQDAWKEPVFGYKIQGHRTSGSGDIAFTNGNSVEEF